MVAAYEYKTLRFWRSDVKNKGKIVLFLCQFLSVFFLFGGICYFFRDGKDVKLSKMESYTKMIEGEVECTAYEYVETDMELLKKYQEYNSDVVGIIMIPDTVLNHPIVQTPFDEDYYLSRDLDRNYNSHGVPFLSMKSQIEGKYGNRVVYGHNIYKISKDVFADLARYEELDFYKEHPIIWTVSKSGTRRWLIVAYFIVDNADDDPFRYSDVTEFLSIKEFDRYFTEVEKRNWLQVPTELSIEDTFLTLSSCSRELSGSGTNRMVVIAKQLYMNEVYADIVEDAAMAENPLLPQRLR